MRNQNPIVSPTAGNTSKLSSNAIERLRKLAAQRLEERRRRPRLLPPDPPPRYDELWEEAMAQLAPPAELRCSPGRPTTLRVVGIASFEAKKEKRPSRGRPAG